MREQRKRDWKLEIQILSFKDARTKPFHYIKHTAVALQHPNWLKMYEEQRQKTGRLLCKAACLLDCSHVWSVFKERFFPSTHIRVHRVSQLFSRKTWWVSKWKVLWTAGDDSGWAAASQRLQLLLPGDSSISPVLSSHGNTLTECVMQVWDHRVMTAFVWLAAQHSLTLCVY